MASEFDNIYNVGRTFQITERPSSIRKTTRESIHSGQFMVSHFEEAEEVVDDEPADVKMPDPDDPNTVGSQEVQVNTCRDIQLYVPRKALNYAGGAQTTNSTLEIETSLTKLFKCMNLTYSQKLTSPKWNHFKGVRLRWKDKIRLNNVIWRCWHMQFILKRRTPVCQFASPLDVDIHNNPQSVVLEGKYWKRHLDVIKAEYRKWRRNFISNAKGVLPCSDTLSDFDLMEFSMTDDRYFFTEDFYMSDILFSTINEPFPFPDRREIAKNASNADLLQPNLGALQPNLDDIDLHYQELLQNARALPPVPEEGAEDLLKSVDNDYQDFSAIIGNVEDDLEQLNSLNPAAPLLTDSIVDPKMEQDLFDIPNIQSNVTNPTTQFSDQVQIPNNISSQKEDLLMKTFPLINAQNQNQYGNFPSNKVKHGRINKPNVGRLFRKREPHNYDKAQPTSHQTSIYQQIVAELTNMQDIATAQQQQRQQQPQTVFHMSADQPMPSQYQISNVPQQNNYSLDSDINVPLINSESISAINKNISVPQVIAVDNASPCSTKLQVNQSDLLSILNFQQNNSIDIVPLAQEQMQNNCPALQFTNQVITPMQVQNENEITKLNSNRYIQSGLMINKKVQQQVNSPKEPFRSNSLPLNASIKQLETREENFLVPKTCTATPGGVVRSRNRSNSMQQNLANTYMQIMDSAEALQNANSEPMLNSTLAQLLKNNNSSSTSSPTNSSASSYSLQPTKTNSPINTATTKTNSLPPSGLMGYQKPKMEVVPMKSNSLPQNLVLQTNSPLLKTSIAPMNLATTPSNSVLSLSPESYISDQDFTPVSPPSYRSGGSSSSNQRRAGHIHAEQKRRYNIKNGFDLLHSLIPQLQHNSNAKLSKAAMLQKGAEYIRQLRSEREELREKINKLRNDRDILNNSLTQLHSVLPANGAPISRQRTEKVKQLFDEYVRMRTLENWKFWILGLIFQPLLNSFTTTVSTASLEELHRTALHWVDQHCSLIELRPAVSNKLRQLSMTTDLLSDPPSTLQEEVIKAIQSGSSCSADEHSNDEQKHLSY
ncbi:carbohydrate-responsive element-binding protein [Condylostylus longicornis]|uniref:carbohydrate-responsive element-binding protein n=1 Tax=Condylostylus longicornis TaxID=2530218 RepID=UPI00244DE969|nr:carbohydrate-responsive element-binding protein [Condylostylus longicornis]XP_055373959.1 carbohydrate-responsive element-binding protein [Condylostylus longicornis]